MLLRLKSRWHPTRDIDNEIFHHYNFIMRPRLWDNVTWTPKLKLVTQKNYYLIYDNYKVIFFNPFTLKKSKLLGWIYKASYRKACVIFIKFFMPTDVEQLLKYTNMMFIIISIPNPSLLKVDRLKLSKIKNENKALKWGSSIF